MDKLDILQKQKQLDRMKVGVVPVRPHLDIMFRTSKGREIFGLMNSDISRADGSFVDVPLAICCVAYCNEVPKNEQELDDFSTPDGSIAVAYTVWSTGWRKGAGRDIIFAIRDDLMKVPGVERLVTLSPLTPMATNFHMKNGAKLISINATTQNFEYLWSVH